MQQPQTSGRAPNPRAVRDPKSILNAHRKLESDASIAADDVADGGLGDAEQGGEFLLPARQRLGNLTQRDPRFFDRHSVECLQDGKQLSTVFSRRSIRGAHGSVSRMGNEGKRLRRLLEDRGVSQTALAAKAGVERAAVNRWLKMELFNRAVWMKAKQALVELGLDPSEIRTDDTGGPREHFVPELEKWDHQHLAVLKRVMMSSQESQKEVLVYLTGALRHR